MNTIPVIAPEPDEQPMPVGVPLWPGLTIAGELVTILSVAAAEVVGMATAGLAAAGVAAAALVAAAGKRYRVASRGRAAARRAIGGSSSTGSGRTGSRAGGTAGRRFSSGLGLPGLGASSRRRAGGSGSSAGSGRRAGGVLGKALGRGKTAAGAGGVGSGSTGRRGLLGGRKPAAGGAAGGSGRRSGAAGRGGALGKLTGGRLGRSAAGRSGTGAGASSGGATKSGRRGTAAQRGSLLNRATGGRLGRKPGAVRTGTTRTGGETPYGTTTRRVTRPARPTVAKTVRRPGDPAAPATAAPGANPKATVPPPAPRPGAAPVVAPLQREEGQLVSTASHSGGITTGGTMVASLGWSAAADEILSRAQRISVGEGEMDDFARMFARESEEMMATIARAFDVVAVKMGDEMPLHNALSDIVSSSSRATNVVGQTLSPFGTAYERLHADQIARIRGESGQPNEKAWNVR